MLKKRLIGVVTVRQGIAVQSIGYSKYLPLGKPEFLIENLDRWGADEILIQSIDRSAHNHGPDINLLERINRIGITTPLIYGGGIRTIEEGQMVIQNGADRILINSMLHGGRAAIDGLAKKIGAQAIIASMPMSLGKKEAEHFNYLEKTLSKTKPEVMEILKSELISEVLVTDIKNEGGKCEFNTALLENFLSLKIPVIAFGGITQIEVAKKILEMQGVVAVAIGNSLVYREHSIQKIKEGIGVESLRQATFQQDILSI